MTARQNAAQALLDLILEQHDDVLFKGIKPINTKSGEQVMSFDHCDVVQFSHGGKHYQAAITRLD